MVKHPVEIPLVIRHYVIDIVGIDVDFVVDSVRNPVRVINEEADVLDTSSVVFFSLLKEVLGEVGGRHHCFLSVVDLQLIIKPDTALGCFDPVLDNVLHCMGTIQGC